MEKKLQVFISSTYNDLNEERQAAVEAILSAGHIPAGMELFTAGDKSQLEVIKRWIDESDVYLLILGGRYGTIETKTQKSYIQLEYEYAVEKSKPLFAIVITDKALDMKVTEKGKQVIEYENYIKYTEFRKTVLKKICKFYDDTKDIKLAIHTTLTDFQSRYNLVGWVSGKEVEKSQHYADELIRLLEENNALLTKKNALEDKVRHLEAKNISPIINIHSSYNIKERVDKILKLLDTDFNVDECSWVNDGKSYSVDEAVGNFSYYYVYLTQPDKAKSEETEDDDEDDEDDRTIDYLLILSIDKYNNFNIESQLADIRVMLENHKKGEESMDFKYVIASKQITEEKEEMCNKFFQMALEKANINNKKKFSLEIWNEDKLLKIEESLGLRIIP